MREKIQILIDTDIGDDADDSLAIALAALSPEIQIAGITTVFRQVEKRAQLARKLMNTLGIETVPIYEGQGLSLNGGGDLSQPPCQWRPEYQRLYTKQPLNAQDYIIQALERDPSLVLVALGPLTNIAAAVRKNPDILRGRQIYMMGGAFDSAYPEWNFLCDPEAVDAVLHSGADIAFFGLELTSKCRLEAEDLQRIAASPLPVAQLLTQMMEDWVSITGYDIFLHDLVPLCALIYPEWFHLSPQWLEVELKGEKTRGTAICLPDYYGNRLQKSNAKTAGMFRPEKVRELFLKRVIRQNEKEENSI